MQDRRRCTSGPLAEPSRIPNRRQCGLIAKQKGSSGERIRRKNATPNSRPTMPAGSRNSMKNGRPAGQGIGRLDRAVSATEGPIEKKGSKERRITDRSRGEGLTKLKRGTQHDELPFLQLEESKTLALQTVGITCNCQVAKRSEAENRRECLRMAEELTINAAR